MAINKSLYIGLSGMSANSTALSTVGDNIANLNTVGFKGSRTIFQDMLGQSLLGSALGSSQGLGVAVGGVERMFEQGALLGTGVATDLAIDGQGFFALEGEVESKTSRFYSRAGQFHMNKDGFMVNPSDLKLLGYTAQPDGTIGSTLAPIQIIDAPFPPVATTDCDLNVNLDSNAKTKVDGAGNPITFDPANPDASANFATSVVIYDELGKGIQADLYFNKTQTGEWEMHVLVDGSAIEGGTAGTKQEIGTGTVQFDGSGKLVANAPIEATFTPSDGASAVNFQIDLSGSTQWANTSTVTSISQDGAQAGSFQSLDINKDGKVIGTFSNGKSRTIAQVALARFRSAEGLDGLGSGLFVETPASGNVVMGAPETVGRGQVHARALEQSNVDLATEFTQLILAQRGYQANSRSISTADQLLQETLNVKR